MLFSDMSVALSGGNGGMTQKLLHHPDVHAVAQQQSRYRMTQHVRGYVPLYSRLAAKVGYDVCDPLGR